MCPVRLHRLHWRHRRNRRHWWHRLHRYIIFLLISFSAKASAPFRHLIYACKLLPSSIHAFCAFINRCELTLAVPISAAGATGSTGTTGGTGGTGGTGASGELLFFVHDVSFQNACILSRAPARPICWRRAAIAFAQHIQRCQASKQVSI